MSKAILILNKMPKDCPYCPVAHYNKLDEFTGCDIVGGKRYAMTTEEGYRNTSKIPTWCPLKPMPERINPLKVDSSNLLDLGYMHGRNDLINEMEGEEQ